MNEARREYEAAVTAARREFEMAEARYTVTVDAARRKYVAALQERAAEITQGSRHEGD